MESPEESRVASKIQSIKQAVNKIGSTLNGNLDITSKPEEPPKYCIGDDELNTFPRIDQRIDKRTASLDTIDFGSSIASPKIYSSFPKQSELWELSMLLEYEREKCLKLEEKINQKEELIQEMTLLQDELYANLDEMQKKAASDAKAASQKPPRGAKTEFESRWENVKQLDDKIFTLEQENSSIKKDNMKLKEKTVKLELKADKARKEYDLMLSEYETLKKKFNAREDDIISLQKERIDMLKELEFHKRHSYTSAGAVSFAPHEEINDLKMQMKVLHEEVCKLKLEKFDLTSKLNKYPPLHVIEELQNSVNSTSLPSHRRHTTAIYENPANESSSYQSVCQDLLRSLGLESLSEVYPRVVHLQKSHSRNAQYKKLFSKLSRLIISSSESSSKHLTPKQIWKWATALLSDYLTLKANSHILNRCMTILNTTDINELPNRTLELSDHMKDCKNKLK